MLLAFVLFDNLKGFRLQLDGVECASLGTLVFQSSIHDLIRSSVKKVNTIDCHEIEHQEKHIHIFLLVRLKLHISERAQLFHCQCTFAGWLFAYFEFTERVVGCQVLLNGLVEYSPEVPEGNCPCIDMGTISSKPVFEFLQPLKVDVFKGK